MELDASLSWLALALTPGLASRLSARLLREFGSPEGIFRARLPQLEACRLPAPVAQAVFKKQSFGRAEKELALTRRMDRCRLLNWTDPEYPQTLLQICSFTFDTREGVSRYGKLQKCAKHQQPYRGGNQQFNQPLSALVDHFLASRLAR